MTHSYFEMLNKPNINSISVIFNSIFVPILVTFTSIIDGVIIERLYVDIEPVRIIWKEVLQFSSYRMLRVQIGGNWLEHVIGTGDGAPDWTNPIQIIYFSGQMIQFAVRLILKRRGSILIRLLGDITSSPLCIQAHPSPRFLR